MDAKAALADRLIDRLEPARRHFGDPGRAAALAEMESLTAVTRVAGGSAEWTLALGSARRGTAPTQGAAGLSQPAGRRR